MKLEAGFTIEKAKVEAMEARLFARLREHFHRRDWLRLVISYRRKYLESLVRQCKQEAGKIAQEYRWASAQQEQEYAETAAAVAKKQELTAGEAAEVSQLWRKLVKLFYPDRFRLLAAPADDADPGVFDETVRRHVASLEKELALLGSEAEELAKKIEELTGEGISGIG